jgi:hypothetical protein
MLTSLLGVLGVVRQGFGGHVANSSARGGGDRVGGGEETDLAMSNGGGGLRSCSGKRPWQGSR